MNRDDDHELWDLLGKSAQPSLSPFFSRNVLREVRQQKGWMDHVRAWLRPRRLVPTAAVALVMVASGLAVISTRDSGDNPPALIAKIDPQDFDTVADLDDLLATDDDGIWNDGDSASL